MDLSTEVGTIESRFGTYVEALSTALGHADRATPFKAYCAGLILPGARKSVEPMAARVDPGRVQAAHQSLHHLVAKADWSDEAVLAAVRSEVLPAIERQGAIRAWIIDDTGFPKKGTHSVGVARQYCGQLGKQDNCQIAVSLSVANDLASLPIGYRLYLPEPWAQDALRRPKAGVPEDVVFRTKPEIALEQIDAALAAGVAPGVVLADAGYGIHTAFLRTGITELGLGYVVGVQSSTSLWPPGTGPLPAKPWSGGGRPPSRVQRQPDHQPVSAKALAAALPEAAWQQGTSAPLSGRFAAVRVRPAHRDTLRSKPRAEEWFLVEWPEGDVEPAKYWLATLPPEIALAELVDLAKLRWRIERDYQELKQEIGLGLFKPVHVKTLAAQEQRMLLTSRKLIQHKLLDLECDLRGTLRNFGLKVGVIGTAGYEARIRHLVEGFPKLAAIVEPLLTVRRVMRQQLATLHKMLLDTVRHDPVCRRFMTVPGVGPVVALTYRASVDQPHRFVHSRAVGAHAGLTPKRHQSGEIDYDGGVSKCGDTMLRAMLYEAAQSMLIHSKKWSWLKAWAMRVAQRRGMRRAIVALARRLAVILHRMWVDGTDFRWSNAATAVTAAG